MAHANTTRSAEIGLGGRFGTAVQTVQEMVRKRGIYTRTLRELRGLTDRDLSDLGLHRSMIAEVAREAAYGK